MKALIFEKEINRNVRYDHILLFCGNKKNWSGHIVKNDSNLIYLTSLHHTRQHHLLKNRFINGILGPRYYNGAKPHTYCVVIKGTIGDVAIKYS